jgi:uncharacterized membrane protein
MAQTIPSVVGLSVVAMFIDLTWLLLNATRFSAIVQDMQGGRPLQMRLWAAIPVYVALGYLALNVDSAPKAFCTGLAAYVVYDFTQVATLDRYPVWFAVADSVWGGILLVLVWWVGNKVGWIQ